MHEKPKTPAYNIFQNIVDHIDYMIGGTSLDLHRDGIYRKAYWRDKALDDAVAELEKKFARN